MDIICEDYENVVIESGSYRLSNLFKKGEQNVKYCVFKQRADGKKEDVRVFDIFYDAIRRFADCVEFEKNGVIHIKPIEVAKDLCHFTNGMNHTTGEEVRKFVHYVTVDEHRTIQHNLFSLIKDLIRAWANSDSFDERNEDVVMTCKKLMEVLENA